MAVTVAGDFGFQGVAGVFAQQLETDGRAGGGDVAHLGQDGAVSGLGLRRNFQLKMCIRDRGTPSAGRSRALIQSLLKERSVRTPTFRFVRIY